MTRRIKLEIHSLDYADFCDLLAYAATVEVRGPLLDRIPSMVMSEWVEGRYTRLVQTRTWTAKLAKLWPERFSEAEAAALMLRLQALPLQVGSAIDLTRNALIDQLHRQLINP